MSLFALKERAKFDKWVNLRGEQWHKTDTKNCRKIKDFKNRISSQKLSEKPPQNLLKN